MVLLISLQLLKTCEKQYWKSTGKGAGIHFHIHLLYLSIQNYKHLQVTVGFLKPRNPCKTTTTQPEWNPNEKSATRKEIFKDPKSVMTDLSCLDLDGSCWACSLDVWWTRWWFQIFFYFHPYLGKIPILTNIFQRGWNHQPGLDVWWKPTVISYRLMVHHPIDSQPIYE